jgi:4-hydroxybenzoate polyprenyltransferase
VASHLSLFDAVMASTPDHNLKGDAKADAIVANAHGAPFSYLGNDASDLAIWSRAATAVVVNPGNALRTRVSAVTAIEHEFVDESIGWKPFVRAIRVHHWLKNLLIFLPLLTSHAWIRPRSVLSCLLAFAAFSLTASAVYLLNDMLDLPSDRRHPVKRLRPFASGDLPISYGLVLAPLLFAAGVGTALAVSPQLLLVLLLYIGITTAYSWILKTYILIDVVTLASLYTIRVIAGAIAIPVTPSFWLLAFSGFLFLSLALVKRCSDLITLANAKISAAAGRDYGVGDLPILQAIGVGTGIAAVVVLALYVNSPDVLVLYARPQWLSLLCVTALYIVMRLWVKAARGQMNNDPLLFAASDRGCLIMAALSIGIVLVGL